MCFNLDKTKEVVTYSDVKVYRTSSEDSYSFFLKKLEDEGGYTHFEALADDFFTHFDALEPKIMEFLRSSDYGISFFAKRSNGDLFDEIGGVIFRGNKYNMKNFLDIRRMKGTSVWDEWMDSFRQSIRDSITFDEFKHAHPDIEVVTSARGYGPDFSYSPQYLFKKNGKTFHDIKIKMTGSRELDYELAFKQAGLDPTEVDVSRYVWHHLDDFDPETGTCTMQLVQKVAHDQVQHMGGVSLWKMFYGGIGYAT